MGSGVILLSLAAMMAQPPQPVPSGPPSGGQSDEIRIGWDLRPLPFRLNMDPRVRPPRSLTEMVDRIYRALPQDRLDMFAAYYGGNDFERIRARYDSTISFFRDLYTVEILYEAGRVWRHSEAHFPLDRARRCVGEDFVAQVAMQIGVRRNYKRGNEGVPPPLRDTGGAYGLAARTSLQLFAICDGQSPPARATRR